MKLEFYNELENTLTKERLSVYRADGCDDNTAIARYLFNSDICKSLYTSLNLFEIAFRNSVDKALQQFTNQVEWYNYIKLQPESANKIASAKKKITNCGKQVTHDRIISELSLGFWTTLFSRKYAQEKFQPFLIKTCFKKAPKNLKGSIQWWQFLDKFRFLRNRVFHFERIVHWKDIETQHENLLNCTRWLSEESYQVLLKTDAFSKVYKKGIKSYVKKVKQNFNK